MRVGGWCFKLTAPLGHSAASACSSGAAIQDVAHCSSRKGLPSPTTLLMSTHDHGARGAGALELRGRLYPLGYRIAGNTGKAEARKVVLGRGGQQKDVLNAFLSG
jgi:hypothetical protein